MTPLKGMPVLITRPAGQGDALAESVKEYGGTPELAPVIHISFREDSAVDTAVRELHQYDVVVVTSANALRSLHEAAERLGVTLSQSPQWVTISHKTAAVAEGLGLRPVIVAGVHTAAELASALASQYEDQAGTRFLVPRGQLGTTIVAETLEEAGHPVTECICYDTVEHHLSRDVWQKYLKSDRIAILLFSPSAVNSLVKQIGPAPLKRKTIYKIAVGPTTARACETLGLEVSAVADEPSSEAVIEALVKVVSKR